MDLRKLLAKLQGAARSDSDSTSLYAREDWLPEDLRTDERQKFRVGPEVAKRIDDIVTELLADVRYEHLAETADRAVWDFVCDAAMKRTISHVANFLRAHERAPSTTTARYGLEAITVGEPFIVHGVTFSALPGEDPEQGERFRRDLNCTAMASVEVSGTDVVRMEQRGRERVQHALRALRLSLANLQQFNEVQLRFRLGQWYEVDGMGRGYHRHGETPMPLTLDQTPADMFETFQLLDLPYDSESGVLRQAKIALEWIDEARLSVNPRHQVGFLFSALEALVCNKSDRLKAPVLVFYRTMLAEIVGGYLLKADRLYELYDQVRSSATHGESVPDIVDAEVTALELTVRSALNEFLIFCRTNGLTKRSAVRAALRDHEQAHDVFEALKTQYSPSMWEDWSPWEVQ